MSAEEVDAELVLPGLVGKEEEKQPGKDKADKVTGQRLKQINLGDDSDEDLDAEDEEDVSDLWLWELPSFGSVPIEEEKGLV